MSTIIASLVAKISADTTGLNSGMAQAKSSIEKTAAGMRNMGSQNDALIASYRTAAVDMQTYSNKTIGLAESQKALFGGLAKGNSILIEGARAANLNGSQTFRMAEATGLYTQRQLASATASEILTKRSHQLADAVSKGKMTAEQAGQTYRRYHDEQQAMINSTMSLSEKYQGFSTKLNQAALGVAKIGAAGAGVFLAGKAFYNLAQSGAEIQFTATKFDRLSTAAGTTSDIFLGQLKQATKGTLSDFQLMRQGSDLLQLGLAKNSDEALRLSRVMTALGMDTGEMTLALANQSKRRLDQLGLSLSRFNEIEAKLKDKGLSKEDSFKEAFLQTAEETVLITGNRADSAAGSFARLGASVANVWDTFKQTLPDRSLGLMFGGDTVSQTAEKVSMFMNGMANLMSGQTVLDFNAPGGMWARQAGAQDISSLWTSRDVLGEQTAAKYGHPVGAQVGLSALQSYTSMAFAYGGGAAGGPPGGGAPQETATDYASLFDGAMKITAQTEKFTEATAKLSLQLDEENEKLELMEKKYGKNSRRLEEQQEKIAGLQNNLNQVKLAATDMGDALLLSNLQAVEGTEQLQLQYALASGEISQRAFDQQNAIMQISGALQSNTISADQAHAAVSRVMSADGFSGKMTMDIYINYIIRGAGGASSNNVTQTMIGDSAVFQGGGGGNQLTERKATGGAVSAFNVYEVAEYGDPEILNVGGKQMLVMGNKSGYIEPARGGKGGGASRDMEAMYAMMSRIPSAEENARALVKAMAKVWSPA